MRDHCTCGACRFVANQWWLQNLPMAEYRVPQTISWPLPHCPVCLTGLGEGGETTPAKIVVAHEGANGGYLCCDAPAGPYYLIPALPRLPATGIERAGVCKKCGGCGWKAPGCNDTLIRSFLCPDCGGTGKQSTKTREA